MKSHSNFYPFKCKDCNYEAKYMHALKQHCRKYTHNPMPAFNPDGTINPFPIIDVYGTRRGPKVKRDSDGNPIYPAQYSAKISVQSAKSESLPVPTTSSPLLSLPKLNLPTTLSANSVFSPSTPSGFPPNLASLPGLLNHNFPLFNTPPTIPHLPQFSYLNSPSSPLTTHPNLFANLSNLHSRQQLPTIHENESSVKCKICSLECKNEEALNLHTLLIHVAKGGPASAANWQTPTRAPPSRRLSSEADQTPLIERILAAKMNAQKMDSQITSPFLDIISNQASILGSKKEHETHNEVSPSGPLDLTKDHTPPQQIIRRRLSENPGEVSPSSLTPPDTISPKKDIRQKNPITASARIDSLANNDSGKMQHSGEDERSCQNESIETKDDEEDDQNFEMDCSMCKITFRSEAMYTSHMKFHGDGNPLTCSFCAESFDNTNKFFEHCYLCKQSSV